eukprot:Phypoly_transcript_07373.p1 GENE.Phypoly_transcript_07373~~Phypoly_transcript_07373.p1  ORF type:complete len:357 (+),score=87.55 Phypoly_transcript_07373:38-1072(+)
MTTGKRGPPTTLIACVACHESHVICGPERPCKRCISRGLADSCKDILPKKRGRPKKDQSAQSNNRPYNNINNTPKLPDSFVQCGNEPAQFDQGINILDSSFDTTFFDDLSALLNKPSSDPYQIEHNVQQLCQMNQPVECPLMQNNKCPEITFFPNQPSPTCPAFSPPCSLPLSSESLPFQQPYNPSPPSSSSASPTPSSHAPHSSTPPPPLPSSSSSSSSCPPTPFVCPLSLPVAEPEPGPYCLSGTSKFKSPHLELVFTHISQRMGLDAIPPSLSPLLAKLVEFYDPLISLYGNRLLENLICLNFCHFLLNDIGEAKIGEIGAEIRKSEGQKQAEIRGGNWEK